MNLLGTAVKQPVTVAVGVLLILLAGALAVRRIPIQLTPNVEDTIIAVTTRWEGASPQEIEQEIVDEQEEKLQGIPGLRAMTSTSKQGEGVVRLEFLVGTSKEDALREVSDKLREVPSYPDNADEPVVEASDPENRDYIAWIVFSTDDPSLDIRTLQDFTEDRIQPVLERVAGVSEVNVLGGREREVQVRVDPERLAQRGTGVDALVRALQRTNQNRSAGAVEESKSDIRVRMVSQYTDVAEVEATVISVDEGRAVYVRDVADVALDFKEPLSFVRSRGKPVIAINAQREVGTNVMEVMAGIQAAVAKLNEAGGLLDTHAATMQLDGGLYLDQVYDQTVYIDDALILVKDNIWLGGLLAIAVLLVFLRSIRSAGLIALAIPISVIGAIVVMVALGRSINVISLAGMAFAVGMVVDNAIVVLENIYRHLEMGKRPAEAALDGAREVSGAILAATLTTVVVFVPILMIEEEAGQLFRDIALSIVASVSLSLLVSITVIPTCAARLLREAKPKRPPRPATAWLRRLTYPVWGAPDYIARLVHKLCGSWVLRVGVVVALTAMALFGTWKLLPPADYLPQGNRNLVFGILVPPPGYSLGQQEELGRRIEETVRPYWEAAKLEPGSPERAAAVAELPQIPTFDFAAGRPGAPVTPPPIDNYFLVAFPGTMFHGGVGVSPERVVDLLPLFGHATRPDVAPGVLAFAFQVPLFRLGGSTGSAVKINFSGDDLDAVSSAAMSVFMELMAEFGPQSIQPDPSNFNIPTPELVVLPNLLRLGEVGLTPADLALAVQVFGDGALVGDFRVGGQTIDLKVVAAQSGKAGSLSRLEDQPVALPSGGVLPLASLAEFRRVNAAAQINREGRQRAVTLQLTPPAGLALEEAIARVDEILAGQREQYPNGGIPATVATSYTGSASKLSAVRGAMLGDGTFLGTLSSSLVLALLVVYLLMCVLFQSFLRPLIILFSVPLATLGGFAALYGTHVWSQSNPYMPVQNLDILTMLGFVILIGVVVNNAILIVHQAVHFMRGADVGETGTRSKMEPREAISASVRSRVRPIFMGTLTSIGGMSPLVFMPGSGSELYRGLGSVVVGGLLVSTVFTLLLVPLMLSMACDVQRRLGVLPELRTGNGGFGVAGTARALTAVVFASLILGGCASNSAPESAFGRQARRFVVDQVEQLDEDSAEDRVLVSRPEPLEAQLAPQRARLEALGAPPLAGVDPTSTSMALDLYGRAQVTSELTLAQAVDQATRNNIGLALARLEPQISAEGVVSSEAEFDVAVFANALHEEYEDPSRIPVLGGIPLGQRVNAGRRSRAEVGVRKRLSSGATVSGSSYLQRDRNRSDGISFAPDPAWLARLRVGVTQPLLRGAGSSVVRSAVALAEVQYRDAASLQRAELLFVLASVQTAYRDLQQAWQQLSVRTDLLERGVSVTAVLEERRGFDARMAELADARARVQERSAQVRRAQRDVQAASDQLKLLMNDPERPPGGEVLLAPSEGLSAESTPLRPRAAIESALANRPEIESALLGIEDQSIREKVAANRTRARLDLTAEVEVQGLDDGVGGAFGGMLEDDFYGVFAGLDFELPAGNRAAEAQLRRTQLQGRRALLSYQSTVLAVIGEVQAALRDVELAWDLIDLARASRLAQSENLRALLASEESRSRMTPEFLNLKFQRQDRLAASQLEEIAAHADYQRALIRLRWATGTGVDGTWLKLDTD